MKTVNEIKDLIAEKREAILGLKTKAETEKRDAFTSEEKTTFNKLVEERKALESDLETAQELESQVAARSFAKVPSVVLDAPTKADKDVSKFNLVRAIQLKVQERALDGAELEMHQEGEKELRAMGQSPVGNLSVPSMVFESRAGHNATGAATEGKTTIETQLRTDNFIDVLYSETWLDKVNVNRMTGLTGNFELMRQSNKTNVQSVAENGVATDSQLSFDKLLFTPNRTSVTLPVSKQLILQSAIAVQNYILGLIKKDFTIKINTDALTTLLAAITENPLTGLTQTNGIALDYNILTELERTLAANDIGGGNFKWLTNPNTRKKAKNIAQLANTISQAVWGDNNEMAGYPAVVSNLIPSTGTKGSGTNLSTLVIGDYSEFVAAQWGGMDLTINPYSLDREGQIRITCDMFTGYGVTRAAAFTKTTQLITI